MDDIKKAKKILKDQLRLKKITIVSLTQVVDASAADPITRKLLGSQLIENIFIFLHHVQEDYQAAQNLISEFSELEAQA